MAERAFFPWASVIRFGLGRLRLNPDAFWALSLPELAALAGGGEAPAHTTRHRLAALMARFPDGRPHEDNRTNKDAPDDR